MFLSDKRFRQLAWFVAKLMWREDNLEAKLSDTSTAIEQAVADLKAFEVRANDKLAALAAAVAAAGSDPDTVAALADLKTEVASVSSIVPVPADAPPADAPPADDSTPPADASAPAAS